MCWAVLAMEAMEALRWVLVGLVEARHMHRIKTKWHARHGLMRVSREALVVNACESERECTSRDSKGPAFFVPIPPTT